MISYRKGFNSLNFLKIRKKNTRTSLSKACQQFERLSCLGLQSNSDSWSYNQTLDVRGRKNAKQKEEDSSFISRNNHKQLRVEGVIVGTREAALRPYLAREPEQIVVLVKISVVQRRWRWPRGVPLVASIRQRLSTGGLLPNELHQGNPTL